jgi:hypothetical protein
VLVLFEAGGISTETLVVDGLEVGQPGEEEAQKVEVEQLLAVLSGNAADGELLNGVGEGMVGKGGVAQAVVAADEGPQLEALQSEGVQTVLVVACVGEEVLMLRTCKLFSLLISQMALRPSQASA